MSSEISNIILPSFKPFDWAEKDEMLCVPLLDSKIEGYEDIPLVAFGIDHPEAFEFISNKNSLEPIKEIAYENILAEDAKILLIDTELPFLVVTNSYFACEKILDKEFMLYLSEKLGAEFLAIGLPRKGEMFVTNAINSIENISRFRFIVENKYEEINERPSLSKTLFLVQDGLISGIMIPR